MGHVAHVHKDVVAVGHHFGDVGVAQPNVHHRAQVQRGLELVVHLMISGDDEASGGGSKSWQWKQ